MSRRKLFTWLGLVAVLVAVAVPIFAAPNRTVNRPNGDRIEVYDMIWSRKGNPSVLDTLASTTADTSLTKVFVMGCDAINISLKITEDVNADDLEIKYRLAGDDRLVWGTATALDTVADAATGELITMGAVQASSGGYTAATFKDNAYMDLIVAQYDGGGTDSVIFKATVTVLFKSR